MDGIPQECKVYYLSESIVSAACFRAKIKKLDERIQNTREDVMLLKTAQEALGKIEAVLKQMRGLAEIASGDDPPFDREALDERFQGLKRDIGDIIASAEYDGVNLLDGSFGDISDIIAALEKTIP